MKKFLRVIRIPAFFLGLIVVLSVVLGPFTVTDTRGYQTFQGFYENEDTPLDAVYIGSSATYAFWQAPFGWEKFGFTVYPLAFPSLSCRSLKYVIEEGRKTQPDALYILNLNTFKHTENTVAQIHYVVDYMPASANKFAMIRELSGAVGMDGLDGLEFYLPFIRFHSGWNELTAERVSMAPEHVLGGVHYASFLNKITDVSAGCVSGEDRGALTQEQERILEDLLQYCRDEQVNCLFVLVPQPGDTSQELSQSKALVDAVAQAGYPVLDLSTSLDQLGLDTRYDFYNGDHVNIHGCVKYMDFLGRYLKENYGFTDKRGDPAYGAWDQALDRYVQIIGPYALDFEHGDCPRDYSLARPGLAGVTAEGGAVTLTWTPTEGADGFFVYRRTGAGAWEQVGQTDGGAGSYLDEGVKAGGQYTYTVVPVRWEGDGPVYGNYDYSGLSVSVEKEN